MQPGSSASKIVAAIEGIAARADVHVIERQVCGPAGLDALAAARGRLPADMLAFHAEMDGVEFEWQFLGGSGGGAIRIPGLTQHRRMQVDGPGRPWFGAGFVSLFVDENIAECGAWLVAREDAPEDCHVIAVPAGGEPRVIARSFAEYVELAVASSFVSWWMIGGVEVEAARERLARAPGPRALVAGRRISTTFYAEGGRGTVREVRAVADPPGTFALVAMDDGLTVWLPATSLDVPSHDAYERAVLSPGAFWDELMACPMLERICQVARALGPVRHQQGRRAAGLLSPLTLEEAARRISSAFGSAAKELRTLGDVHSLVATGGEADPTEWRRHQWQLRPRDTLDALCAGLALRVAEASARERRPPAQVFGARAAALLRWVPGRSAVLDLLAQTQPARPAPRHLAADEVRERLALGDEHPVGLGTGY